MMTSYYRNSKILPLIPFIGPKIAWVTSGAPVEILVSMGILPLYPENYGAVVGAQKKGVTLCQVAESHGWSQDLCSYARVSLGSVLNPKISPMKGLRKPDVLICGNNICGTVMKWYEALSHHFHIPMFMFDTPPVRDRLEKHQKEYVMKQLWDLIEFLQSHTGKNFVESKLNDAARLSSEAVQLWRSVLYECKAKPTPLNCADRFLAMAPIVTRRGTKKAVDYYQILLGEIKDRVKKGEGAITVDEKTRLLWDNIPMWYNVYKFFNSLAAEGVVFPVDTYTHAWSGAITGGDPIEEIAKMYSTIYLNQTLNHKIDLIVKLINEFDLDGFVLHSDRSCKRYSLGQPITKRIVQERTGVPGVIIEADMCDSRVYSEEQVRTRIEGLLEMIHS